MKTFWNGLPIAARSGLAGGVVLLLALLAGASWWLLQRDYDVLFADLRPQDAALMTAELDKLRQAYRLSEDGTAILVEKSAVPATRLKLMGRELPLQGGVGLELFNNADFGMTEFAEKINYQRALQGELTRTIMALSEIREARVHLAFAEQGVFRQNTTRPKAAITVSMKPGQTLLPAQVAGMQRLVAAAVSGMTMDDVTIVDRRGIALTRPAENDAPAAAGTRLELKRETEDYLSRKAGAVLEQALGPGQALASVDVSLNMDQMRVTTEDILPANASATGVVVRERETLGGQGSAGDIRNQDSSRSAGVRQRETDYHAGKRVEQIVSQPGSIRRIQVLAVLRPELDAARREQLRALVSAAVGVMQERGDVVVVESFSGAAATTANVLDGEHAGAGQAGALRSPSTGFPVIERDTEPGTKPGGTNAAGPTGTGTGKHVTIRGEHGAGAQGRQAQAGNITATTLANSGWLFSGMAALAVLAASIIAVWQIPAVLQRWQRYRRDDRNSPAIAGEDKLPINSPAEKSMLDHAQRENALRDMRDWLAGGASQVDHGARSGA